MGWAPGVLFKEDFFERIINVAWGVRGGVFVAGFWSMYGDVYSVTAGAYGYANADDEGKHGQPGFVLGGDIDVGGGTFQAQIYFSDDGETWQKVWVDSQAVDSFFDVWDSYVTAMCWNLEGKQFYAEVEQEHAHYALNEEGHSYEQYYSVNLILLSSSNGVGWLESGRKEIMRWEEPDGGGPGQWVKTLSEEDNKNGIISPYCNPKAPKTKQGGPLPDGLYGYSEKKDNEGNVIENTVVEVVPPIELAHAGGGRGKPSSFGNSLKITIEKGGKKKSKTVSSGVTHANAVAFAGEAIVVAGGDRFPSGYPDPPSGPTEVAVSTDMGEQWGAYTGETTGVYMIVIGAPKKDLGKISGGKEDDAIVYGFKAGSATKIEVPPPKPKDEEEGGGTP